MAGATAAHKTRSHKLPQPIRPWTDFLLAWKIEALRRVLDELQHACSGPNCHPKSCTLMYTIRHTVAAEADPEYGIGVHMQHILANSIAQEIISRDGTVAECFARFPGREGISPAFLTKYVNSRWWCEVFCELETICCADVMGVVESAIASAESEMRRMESGHLAHN